MKQPNILLITTDQQRFDTVGDCAPRFLRTPHLDQLSREGISFTRAYSACPICVPARISIMTGKHPFAHGVMHNGASSEVMGNAGTLPTALGGLGYQTAGIGKMHFTPQRRRHGFDEMIIADDYFRQLKSLGVELQPLSHGLGQNEMYPTRATVPESLTFTSWTAEQCAKYITTRRDLDVPFFLWCSFSKPHPPLDPPEPYFSMYTDSDISEPVVGNWRSGDACPEVFRREQIVWDAEGLAPETLRAARAAYYGMITHIDYQIGRLFAALHETGLYDDTLILFTSDHGEMLGDHRAVSKTYFYESSARVPLTLRLPQTWHHRCHGETNSALADMCDIMPTLLSAAGTDDAHESDGMDLTAVARGERSPREWLEGGVRGRAQPHGFRFMADWGCYYVAITDGSWKYIWYSEGGCEQLFDLEKDPNELTNLAHLDDHRRDRERLRFAMIQRHQERGSDLVKDGDLVSLPKLEISDADLRNNYRLGCLTEETPHDIRH